MNIHIKIGEVCRSEKEGIKIMGWSPSETFHLARVTNRLRVNVGLGLFLIKTALDLN